MKNIILFVLISISLISLSSCSRRSLLIGSYLLSKNSGPVSVNGYNRGYVTVDLKNAGEHNIKLTKGDGSYYKVDVRKQGGGYSCQLGVGSGTGRQEFTVPEAGSYIFTVDGIGRWVVEID